MRCEAKVTFRRCRSCALKRTLYKSSLMKAEARLLILAVMSMFASMILEGCRGHRTNEPGPGARTTITTTTTVTRTTRTTADSDITAPGHPEAAPSPTGPGRVIGTSASVPASSAAPKVTHTETTRKKSKTSPPQAEFPTAKLVPGKPGYVFSPFDSKGRYVDVSGYTPGSKVKDPWTDKIFIVP